MGFQNNKGKETHMTLDYLSLRKKNLRDVDIDEVVHMHLDANRYELNDYYVVSLLKELERTMQHTRGSIYSRNYAPLLCGFAILDQLGGCYADKHNLPSNQCKSDIQRALHTFGGYNENSNESEAFYALRNCLVHHGALSRRMASGKYYTFRFNWEAEETIQLSQSEWDGQAENISPDICTIVNPRAFTNAILDIIRQAKSIMDDRQGDLDIKQSKTDLLHSYLVWTEK